MCLCRCCCPRLSSSALPRQSSQPPLRLLLLLLLPLGRPPLSPSHPLPIFYYYFGSTAWRGILYDHDNHHDNYCVVMTGCAGAGRGGSYYEESHSRQAGKAGRSRHRVGARRRGAAPRHRGTADSRIKGSKRVEAGRSREPVCRLARRFSGTLRENNVGEAVLLCTYARCSLRILEVWRGILENSQDSATRQNHVTDQGNNGLKLRRGLSDPEKSRN